jgi:hypothetical protein
LQKIELPERMQDRPLLKNVHAVLAKVFRGFAIVPFV